jgi:hypothetical protein
VRRAAHRPHLQGPQLAQAALPGSFLPGQPRGGGRTGEHIVRRRKPFGRSLDQPGPVELEEQAAADHVAQRAIGLDPVPDPAQFGRKPAAALAGVLRDEALDKGGIRGADFPPPVTPQCR